MHSVFSLGALALGLLSMTGSAFASEIAGDASHLVARAPPRAPRGRPNHAAAYGYPHGRGDHSGVRSPVPPPGPPMSPGGYVDPRPTNQGAQCRTDSACSTDVVYAHARCVNRVCTYSCLPGFMNVRGACAPNGAATGNRCNRNARCTTTLANAHGLCDGGYCTYECNAGFYSRGTQCAKTSDTCGGKTCPAIPGGYNVCSRGQCTPQCPRYLGYSLHTDGNGNLTCINPKKDPNQCGGRTTPCPGGYNGKGRAVCNNGVCGLNCGRLQKRTQPDGTPYCA